MTTGRPTVELAVGMPLGDHFVVLRMLGEGGMGEVYLAENVNVPDRRYAIKVLRRELSNDPRFVDMLRDEAIKQARLKHDNVVGMVDFFLWNGHYCLILDYIEGKTIARMIVEQPAGLPLVEALTLITGVLRGLDAAHAIGILHCDVKPANVIVEDRDGRPRVTDFGISRDIGKTTRDSAVVGAGTAEYMSPEQVLRPFDIDHRTDVFSAGVMLFEMLSGRLPFKVTPDMPLKALPQLTQDAPDVRRMRRDVPEAVARIVATALLRDPADRFQGCGDFAAAIDDYRRRERWRKVWLPVIAGMSVVAVAGAAGLYAWHESVLRGEREAALQSANRNVAAASASFGLLCREWTDYQLKAPFIAKARQGGVPEDKVRQYVQRLDGMQANMKNLAADYGRAMTQLKATDAVIVDTALTSRVAAGDVPGAAATMLRTDASALRAGGAVPGIDLLRNRCAAPVGLQN